MPISCFRAGYVTISIDVGFFSIVESEKIETFLSFIIYLLRNYFGVLVVMGEGFMRNVVKLVKIQ